MNFGIIITVLYVESTQDEQDQIANGERDVLDGVGVLTLEHHTGFNLISDEVAFAIRAQYQAEMGEKDWNECYPTEEAWDEFYANVLSVTWRVESVPQWSLGAMQTLLHEWEVRRAGKK